MYNHVLSRGLKFTQTHHNHAQEKSSAYTYTEDHCL